MTTPAPATPGNGLKALFPALLQTNRGKPLVYLDSACTTPAPEPVVEAIADYYRRHPACHGRASHSFASRVTERFEAARRSVQRLIHAAHPDEIVFTRNATEGINLLAFGLRLEAGDVVLASDIEHNSNLLPWQRLAESRGIEHRIFGTANDTTFDFSRFETQLAAPGLRLVTVVHTSNVTGVTLPVGRIVELAHARGVPVLVDATQSAAARNLDVQAVGADFAVLSMHKAYGPSGVGVLYGRRALLQDLPPLLVGGETVDDTTYTTSTPSAIPQRFEAGLQNYAGVLGAGAAADFLCGFPRDAIAAHHLALNAHATAALLAMPKVRILGPADPALRGNIVNFLVEGRQAFEVARLLDQAGNIMVRPGMQCAHSWYHGRGHSDSVRASFGLFNDIEDADRLVRVLGDIVRMF